MFRRPKVQFKPKINTISDRKNQLPAKPPADVSATPVESEVEQATANGAPTAVVPNESQVSTDALFSIESVTQCDFELENVNSSNVPLNCLNEESFDTSDSLTTHEVLIETSDVFAVPHPVQPLPPPETRTIAVILEPRRPVTLKAKETAAALTVSNDGSQAACNQSEGRDKKQPRKPKICLSSNRIRLPIDKSKATMMDLLSYNPPMSEEQKERRRKADEEAEQQSQRSSTGSPSKNSIAPSLASQSSDSLAKGSLSKGASSGPRVKIGANGEIVIDEESLILTKKVDAVTDTVYEGSDQADSHVTYASFRNKSGKKTRWTDEETIKFYKSLSAVGSDFSLMSKIFFNGSRSRLDLRNKFKKEEKLNQHLIDKALANTDLSLLDEIDLQGVGSEDEHHDDQNVQPVHEPIPSVVDEMHADDNNNESPSIQTSTTKRGNCQITGDEDVSSAPRKKRKSTSKPTDSRESHTQPRRSLRHRK